MLQGPSRLRAKVAMIIMRPPQHGHGFGRARFAWLAAQPWCNGSVGMMGISWGGFNGLQIAACRPPALKAIVTICSTDDRYADDAHYMGGTFLTKAGLSGLFSFSA